MTKQLNWVIFRFDSVLNFIIVVILNSFFSRKDHSTSKMLQMILVRRIQSNAYNRYVPKEWIGSDIFHLTSQVLANKSCSDWIKTQANKLPLIEGTNKK